jgi:hypothetical protein
MYADMLQNPRILSLSGSISNRVTLSKLSHVSLAAMIPASVWIILSALYRRVFGLIRIGRRQLAHGPCRGGAVRHS